jgi:hypothetical protein
MRLSKVHSSSQEATSEVSVRVETTERALSAYGGAELLRAAARAVGLAEETDRCVSLQVVRSSRQLTLRLPERWPHLARFRAALARLEGLTAFQTERDPRPNRFDGYFTVNDALNTEWLQHTDTSTSTRADHSTTATTRDQISP